MMKKIVVTSYGEELVEMSAEEIADAERQFEEKLLSDAVTPNEKEAQKAELEILIVNTLIDLGVV